VTARVIEPFERVLHGVERVELVEPVRESLPEAAVLVVRPRDVLRVGLEPQVLE